MKENKNERKLKELLESREKVLRRLERVDESREELKNRSSDFSWHEGTRLRQIESEREVLQTLLAEIEGEIKNL
jgi:hypothetical protein